MESAEWLFTCFDATSRRLWFSETTREILTSASFLDGRTPVSSSGRTVCIEFNDAVTWRRRDDVQSIPDRLVAHVGFCGSTLAARVLDATAVCQSYKEPQVVTDISALKTLSHTFYKSEADWRELIALVKSQFRKSFDGLAPVLKASNWWVNLLPDLCSTHSRVVFMTSEPRDYLIAVLRGGSWRVRFLLLFAKKLRNDFPQVHQAISAIESTPAIGKGQLVLRTALIALAVQRQMFQFVADKLPPAQRLIVDGRSFIEAPEKWLAEMSEALALPIPDNERSRAARLALATSSKEPATLFDPEAHKALSNRVSAAFQMEIQEALDWGQDNIAKMI
jgi:hypothetical protein